MRIVFNNNEFQAEFAQGELWSGDLDAVKTAGFSTSGPPEWTWKTNSLTALNYLRNHKPQSGLTISELALEKYNQLQQKHDQKAALKKQFQTLQKQAAKSAPDTNKYYVDEYTGITCVVVEPKKLENNT